MILVWSRKAIQRVRTHEGVVGRRRSQWTNNFSQNSGTYVVYNSHVTGINSSFSLVMLFVPHWLLAQAHFCGQTYLPPSPNTTTSIGQGDVPIITLLILSSAGCSCLNIRRYTAPVGMMTIQWSLRSYPCICQQHPLYSHLQVTLIQPRP